MGFTNPCKNILSKIDEGRGGFHFLHYLNPTIINRKMIEEASKRIDENNLILVTEKDKSSYEYNQAKKEILNDRIRWCNSSRLKHSLEDEIIELTNHELTTEYYDKKFLLPFNRGMLKVRFTNPELTTRIERNLDNASAQSSLHFPNLQHYYALRDKLVTNKMNKKYDIRDWVVNWFDSKWFDNSSYYKLDSESNKTTFNKNRKTLSELISDIHPIEMGKLACKWAWKKEDENEKGTDINLRKSIAKSFFDKLVKSEDYFTSVTDKRGVITAEFCTLERIMEKHIADEMRKEQGKKKRENFNADGFEERTLVEWHDSIEPLARESKYYNQLKHAFKYRKEYSDWLKNNPDKMNEIDNFELAYIRAGKRDIKWIEASDLRKIK